MGIQAYKDSEVGRIPLDWSVKQIGKIGYTYSGLTGKGKNDFGKGNSRYITFLNVLNNPVLRTDIFERVYVSDGEHQNLALKGDLFFNTSSETPEEVGICALLDDNVPNLYLNSFCFGYRLTDPEVDGLFLSYFFRSKAGRDIMTMLAQGATRYNLSKESFNKTVIAFPPFEEQKKIADALSGVDDMIGALDEAIAKKRQIKEGLMQQLLAGETRLPGFSGEWKREPLSKHASVLRGGSPRPIEAYLTNDPDGINWIKIGDVGIGAKYIVKTEERIIPDGVSHSRAVKAGDFLLSNSMSFGRPYILKIDGCIHDGWLVIQEYYDSFDTDYLYYALNAPETIEQYKSMAAGSSVLNLNKDIVKRVMLNIPEIDEQRAIASVLSSADNEIVELESKRNKYDLIKQGMMQDLLTGKTRLI